MCVGQRKNGKTAARWNMRSKPNGAAKTLCMSTPFVTAMPSVVRLNSSVVKFKENCRSSMKVYFALKYKEMANPVNYDTGNDAPSKV